MKTTEFYNLESRIYSLVEEINEVRQCYNSESWLTDKLYQIVLIDKIKKIKEAIDEAIKANVF